MRPWGRFLTWCLEGWIGLIQALGARGVRWEWKKQSWRQGLERRIAAWENLERGVRTRMRMCRACRALVDAGESVCPSCGASMAGVPKGGIGRLLRLWVPSGGSLSMLLVSANVAMSLLALALWGAEPQTGFMSLLCPPWQGLFVLGEKAASAIFAGQVWRLVTANYLHGGVIHLVFNCYALMMLGPLIETSFGWRKFFLIYTTTGVAAFTVSTLFRPGSPSVGASGALFGLLGFAVVFGRYRGGASGRAISDHLMTWLLYGVVMFLIPGIDNSAHVGGAVCGAILGLVVDPGEPRTPAGRAWLWFLTAVAILATVGSFAAMALSYRANLEALGGA